MKNTILSTLTLLALATSCADKKENREEFKENHNKDSLRNTSGDNAVNNSEPVNSADSSRYKTDTAQTPTNYKDLPVNKQGGGSR
ncbi:hypothetical protein ASG31_09580 [Chryseobacterium sp. Leaf404]|uniref:hypothetical protein n=1 Tax=unclassified Chryseobacterium TaxID=2593645 RepID=UPI0006F9A5AB|nr:MULTISPECIES: hypothetical protein [unclassified Chryseobacterium]KQT17635.1 hypothetical protein ASG31_09580 [Chryseobacterium sp. Leaf404]